MKKSRLLWMILSVTLALTTSGLRDEKKYVKAARRGGGESAREPKLETKNPSGDGGHERQGTCRHFTSG